MFMKVVDMSEKIIRNVVFWLRNSTKAHYP